MIKKTLTAFLAAFSIVLMCSAASAAGISAAISLNGSTLDMKAQVSGTAVYLPVRGVLEGLGYNVAWADRDGVQTAVASRDNHRVTLSLTHQEIDDNSHTFAAGVYTGRGIVVIGGRMYLDSGLLCSVFPVSAAYDSKNNVVTLLRRYENNIAVATEKLTSDHQYLKATIQYPQLTGLADAAVQAAINAVFEKSAQNALAEGEKNAAELAQAIKDGYTGAVGQCETYYDYMVAYNQNGLLSVVLTNYQYAGGAHGSTVQSAYTFDLATGKILQLSDLMDSGSDYKKFFNDTIRNEIDRRVETGALYEFDFSKFKDIGTRPEFYLSNSAVVIYFQEYAYFPYAAGIQEFAVKYEDLKNMTKKEYGFLSDAPVPLQPAAVTTLTVGNIGQVVLQGNASTGYTWHYAISDTGVLALSSEYSSSAAPRGLVGAGSTYTWNFKALKTGASTITFKYYRDWEGESSATPESTVVYQVAVP